jgi:ABC-2 type transport system ATP-binding protein
MTQPTTGDPVITTSGLRKSFRSARGTVDAVKGVDLEVRRGEIFGFLGPNGAGKTTTLRMLTTLLSIDGGSARVAGYDVATEAKQVRTRIGYVSQLGGADQLATGRENLILQGRLYGGEPDEVARRSEELMALLDLADFADRRVRTYSGGQRRRLDIALGIVHQPELLFLDEPSTGLDPQSRANLWGHVRSLRDRGTTIFLTTHYLEEADALSDRLVIMDHGRIITEGTPRELKREVAGESVLLSLHDGTAAVERAAALLGAQDYVREVSSEGEELRLYVSDGSSALPQLLRVLDAAGLSIRSIRLSEPTLDDVFLRQTGRSLRDAGPTSAEEVA